MAEGSERIDAADNTPARSQILAALQARGAQPTGENMSRLLVANAQNPGVIPGVRNMPPIVSPGDPGSVGPMPARGGPPPVDPNASRGSTNFQGAQYPAGAAAARGSTNFPSNADLAAASAPTGPGVGDIVSSILLSLLPGAAVVGGSRALGGRPSPEGNPLFKPPAKPAAGSPDTSAQPEPTMSDVRSRTEVPAPAADNPLNRAISRAVGGATPDNSMPRVPNAPAGSPGGPLGPPNPELTIPPAPGSMPRPTVGVRVVPRPVPTRVNLGDSAALARLGATLAGSAARR